MKAFSLYLFLGGLLPFVVVGQTIVDSFRGEIRSCETACEKSFSAQDEKEAKLYSFCKNGCRLLNVLDVLESFSNLNDTKTACFKCCEDSYSDAQNIKACQFGCESQLPSAEKRKQQIEDYYYSQQLDSLSPILYIDRIFSNMLEKTDDRMIRSYYSQTFNGGLVVVAESSSIISGPKEDSPEGNTFNYIEMRGVMFRPVVDLSSFKSGESLSLFDEINAATADDVEMKSDVMLHTCFFLKNGVSHVLAACLLILFVLFIIWIWTSGPTSVAQQEQILFEKQNLKCADEDDDELLVVSAEEYKAGPPQYCIEGSQLRPMEVVGVNSAFPIKVKMENV